MLKYLRLEIVRTFRDRRFLFFSLAFPVMLYLLWTNVFGSAETDVDTGLGLDEYMMVSFGAYGAIGAALSTTGPRLATELQDGWLKQLQVTPLRAWHVIAARILTALVVALPCLILVGVVAVLTQGVSLSAVQWIETIGLLTLAILPFAALGTLIGATVKGDSAQPAMLMTYLPLAIIGGLWVPVAQLPTFLQKLAPYTPANRMAELGWDIVGGAGVSGSALLVLAVWTIGLGALGTLGYRRATVAA
ncbi:ABC transporter permease [Actinocorallia lasiicapitis]